MKWEDGGRGAEEKVNLRAEQGRGGSGEEEQPGEQAACGARRKEGRGVSRVSNGTLFNAGGRGGKRGEGRGGR